MTILSEEITNDPLGLGYASYLPDAPGMVVELLNKKQFTKVGDVSKTAFAVWAVKYNIRAQIENIAADTQSPLQSAALALKDLLQTANNSLNLSDPDIAAFVDLWPMSAEAKAALVALGQVPASRAEVLGLPLVTVYDLIQDGVI